MTNHLPLTPGHYMTASGPVTITSIGKSGKRAYSDNCGWWHVETGEHRRDPALDITGRVEPAEPIKMDLSLGTSPTDPIFVEPGDTLAGLQFYGDGTTIIKFNSTADGSIELVVDGVEIWSGPDHMAFAQWLRDMTVKLARVTAERDEAVAERDRATGTARAAFAFETRALLAKIGRE